MQFIRNWLNYYCICSNRTDTCILYRLVQNTDLIAFKPLFSLFWYVFGVIVLLQDYISERISGFLKLKSRQCSKLFTDRIVLILLLFSASFLATFQSVHSHIVVFLSIQLFVLDISQLTSLCNNWILLYYFFYNSNLSIFIPSDKTISSQHSTVQLWYIRTKNKYILQFTTKQSVFSFVTVLSKWFLRIWWTTCKGIWLVIIELMWFMD